MELTTVFVVVICSMTTPACAPTQEPPAATQQACTQKAAAFVLPAGLKAICHPLSSRKHSIPQ